MIQLDERGKQCPLPVIEAKKALENCPAGESVRVIVDNEIAVQNLLKMAGHKDLKAEAEKISDDEFAVCIEAGDSIGQAGDTDEGKTAEDAGRQGTVGVGSAEDAADGTACIPDARRRGTVVVLSSNQMGQGDEALGKLLMKGFVYALTEQDALPELVLLYNSGAFLSCEGSDSLEDLKLLESQGVEILTCGTCLNHYGLSEKLAVGAVTNMYEIVERMTGAKLLVRP